MEQFIVSARKYRPATFEDVVGQRAITKTLENAIESNKLAQALLFTGPRGVGKTTCARILAKRINQDGTENEDEDFAFNIFELDAASNNSVDDIRTLIEQVRIPPQTGRYKIYIIDEVHMLSNQAFNAFLKTLEEPPKHAIFILATTEKHKIIPTILSRCQIFDFKRIGVTDIKEHLHNVAKSEGIIAEDDALHLIAQKADGALRDALSTFDRVVSFSGKNLTREAVAENLNILDYSWFFRITDLLLNHDIPQVLLTYNEIMKRGFDGHHFIMGLASHFRDLLVSKNPGTIELLEVGDDVKKMYLDQSQKASPSFLIEGINIAKECDYRYRSSQNQRLLVELALMQLASLNYQGEKKNSNPTALEKPFIIPPSQIQANPVPKTQILPKENQEEKHEEIKEEFPKSVQPENDSKADEIPSLQKTEPPVIPEGAVSIFSIKSVAEQIEKEKEVAEEEAVSQEELPEKSFSEEDFIATWKEYVEMIEGQGKFNLMSHLTMAEPELRGTIIHIEYPNHTIKTEVEREKGELLKFLKEKLENHKIDLSITVNEKIQKKYVYSPKEKFEKLKEKNPLVEVLREQFGLDL